MPRFEEKAFLFLSDFIAINSAFLVWAWLRHEMGFFAETDVLSLFKLSVIVFFYWFLLFLFFGLYGSWYAQSRVDELISIFKTITLGVFLIFLITFDLERDLTNPPSLSRMFLINYWLLLIGFVSSTRMLFRTFQRILLSAGIGLRRAIIVGWGKRSWNLFDEILNSPALGYDIVGFVSVKDHERSGLNYKNRPLLGSITNIEEIAKEQKVQEIIIALDGPLRRKLMDVVNRCNGLPVKLKIVPDLYDIVIGQARTNQIYGLPLIEILPQFMPAWEQKVKRFLDIVVSVIILVALLPLWLAVAVAIKLDSDGPVFYRQKRVGRNGARFTMYKFRSMVNNAEEMTGPKWAEKDDPRITRVGRWIRRFRIDEIPQFINVLKGDMSLVGPRPERPYFVDRLKEEIPLYSRRLRVRPGITGWAQVKGDYDSSVEDVKRKLQYDFFYLENMSLRMDLKILLATLYVMVAGRGQ
jgi:exopolysaccharide biosynthesis polyprenyl glycosylphosphotransferase